MARSDFLCSGHSIGSASGRGAVAASCFGSLSCSEEQGGGDFASAICEVGCRKTEK